MKKPTPGRLPNYVFRYLRQASPTTFANQDSKHPETARIITKPASIIGKNHDKISWFMKFINWIKKLWQ